MLTVLLRQLLLCQALLPLLRLSLFKHLSKD